MADVGENNPVVKGYLKDLEEYFATRHDDYADMLNFIRALNVMSAKVQDQLNEHITEVFDEHNEKITQLNQIERIIKRGKV
jgi:hypothetical protein